MSDETGLYDKLEFGGEPFRRWHSTGTLEVWQDGKWNSIPCVAQRALESAIAAEREACAKIAEAHGQRQEQITDNAYVPAANWAEKQASEFIAAAIRARGTVSFPD